MWKIRIGLEERLRREMLRQIRRSLWQGECGIFSPKLLECFRLAKKELEEQAIALKDELETE